ncbi:unnamed protein product, partial [Arabidopsis halleri]
MTRPTANSLISVENFLMGAKSLITLPPKGLSSTPLYSWLLWQLWKACNQLLFEDRSTPALVVLNRAIVEARRWMESQLLLSRNLSPPPAPSPQPPCLDTHDRNSANHKFVGSALIAETLAVKFALLDAQSAGFHKLKVFSDCKVLISLLNTGNSNVDLRSLLHDIRDLNVSFTSICFQFVPRLKNVLADRLAKSAL